MFSTGDCYELKDGGRWSFSKIIMIIDLISHELIMSPYFMTMLIKS